MEWWELDEAPPAPSPEPEPTPPPTANIPLSALTAGDVSGQLLQPAPVLPLSALTAGDASGLLLQPAPFISRAPDEPLSALTAGDASGQLLQPAPTAAPTAAPEPGPVPDFFKEPDQSQSSRSSPSASETVVDPFFVDPFSPQLDLSTPTVDTGPAAFDTVSSSSPTVAPPGAPVLPAADLTEPTGPLQSRPEVLQSRIPDRQFGGGNISPGAPGSPFSDLFSLDANQSRLDDPNTSPAFQRFAENQVQILTPPTGEQQDIDADFSGVMQSNSDIEAARQQYAIDNGLSLNQVTYEMIGAEAPEPIQNEALRAAAVAWRNLQRTPVVGRPINAIGGALGSVMNGFQLAADLVETAPLPGTDTTVGEQAYAFAADAVDPANIGLQARAIFSPDAAAEYAQQISDRQTKARDLFDSILGGRAASVAAISGDQAQFDQNMTTLGPAIDAEIRELYGIILPLAERGDYEEGDISRAMDYARLAAYSGPDAEATVFKLILRKDEIVEQMYNLGTKIQEQAFEGRDNLTPEQISQAQFAAAYIGDQALSLDQMSETDIVDRHESIWSEIALGAVLDPTVALGWLNKAAKLSPVTRRSQKAVDGIVRIPKEGQAYIDRILDATALDSTLVDAGGTFKRSKELGVFEQGLKASSIAHRARFTIYRTVGSFIAPIQSKVDAKRILVQWLDDPKALAQGIENLESPLTMLRSDPDTGRYFLPVGALTSKDALDARKSLLAVRSEVENLASLVGDGTLSHAEFAAELSNAAWKGALKRTGALAEDIPLGTTKVTADGANVRFLNVEGGELGRLVVESERLAKEMAGNLTKATDQLAARGLNVIEAVGSVQRAVMSGLTLNASPRALIRHVAANTMQLKLDGIYSLEKNADRLAWAERKYGGTQGTVRTIDALDAERTGGQVTGGVQFESGGKHNLWSGFGLVGDNPLSRGSDRLKQLRSGLTQAGSADIGEEAFALGSWTEGARRVFNKQWEKGLRTTLGRSLDGMGIDPGLRRWILAETFTAGINGGINDVGRKFREAINGASRGFSIMELGPFAEALSPAGHDRLADLFRGANGRPRQQLVDEVISIFDEDTAAPRNILGQAPPDPGRNIFGRQEDMLDVSDIAGDLRRASQEAGLDPAMIDQFITDAGDELRNVHRQGRIEIINALMDSTDPAMLDWVVETWSRIDMERTNLRKAMGEAFEDLIQLPGAERGAAWSVYFDDYARNFRDMITANDSTFSEIAQSIRAGTSPGQGNLRRLLESSTVENDTALLRRLGVEVGSAKTDQPMYEMVMEAGRRYVDRGSARLYWSARHVLDLHPQLAEEIFDRLASYQRHDDKLGAAARGKVAPLQERVTTKGNKYNKEKFYPERNQIWRESFWARRMLAEDTAKEVLLLADEAVRPIPPGAPSVRPPDGEPVPLRVEDITPQSEEALARTIDEIEAANASSARAARVDALPDELQLDAATNRLPILTNEGGVGSRNEPLPQPQRPALDPEAAPVVDLGSDTGRGERLTTAAAASSDRIAELEQVKSDMEQLYDRAAAEYQNAPSLRKLVNQRGSVEDFGDDRILREFSEYLTGDADGIPGWVSQYEGIRAEIGQMATRRTDARRFTSGAGARLSRDEILASEDVQRMLGEMGFPLEDARQLDRRQLLSMLADMEGNEPSLAAGLENFDFETYFYSGVPVGQMIDKLGDWFNLDEGETLLTRLFNTNKQRLSTRSVKQPTIGDVAYHKYEHSNDALLGVLNNIDRITTGEPNMLTVPQRRELERLFAGQIAPLFEDILAAAAKAGEEIQSFGMVDFAKGARYADDWVGLAMPYHFWYSRALKNTVERTLYQPQYLTRLARVYREMRGDTERRDFPDRNRDTFVVGEDDENYYYVRDPIATIYASALPSFWRNDFANPDQANGRFDKWYRTAQQYGLSVFPWTDWGVRELSGGESRTAGQVIPQIQTAGLLYQLTTGNPAPKWSTVPWQPYYTSRQAANANQRGELSSLQTGLIQDVARQDFTGEAPLPEQLNNPQLTQDIKKLRKSAAAERFWPRVISAGTGILTGAQPKAELELSQANDIYRNLGYDPEGNTLGGQGARTAALNLGNDPQFGDLEIDPGLTQAFGNLPARWGQSATTRDSEQSDRPGVRAVTGAAYDARQEMRDQLYGSGDAAADAAAVASDSNNRTMQSARRDAVADEARNIIAAPMVDNFLNQNPEATATDLVNFVTDTVLGEDFPSADLSPSERRTDERNPVEVEDGRIEDILRQAGDYGAPPIWPGASGSSEEKGSYYDARETYEQERLAWLVSETGLPPGEAQQRLQDWQLRFRTDTEKERLAAIAETNQTNSAHWDQYISLSDSGAKAKYLTDNPEFAEVYAKSQEITAPGDRWWLRTPISGQLYGAGDAAVDAAIAANPNISRDEMRAARRAGIVQAAKGVIGDEAEAYLLRYPNASYADLVRFVGDSVLGGPESEKSVQSAQIDAPAGAPGATNLPDRLGQTAQKPTNNTAPTAKFNENVRAAANFDGRPEWPGDGAGQEAKAAFYAANVEWKDRRVKWLALKEGISEEEAGTLLDSYLNRNKTAAEIRREVQIGGEQQAISAHWDAYTQLSTSGEKGEYLRANPDFANYYADRYDIAEGDRWWNGDAAGGTPAAISAHWEAYKLLGDTQQKAQYLRDNPDFANYYADRYDIAEGDRWWNRQTGGRSGGGRSYGGRSGGGRSSGGGFRSSAGGNSYSSFFPSIASLAQNTPRVNARYMNSNLWTDVPWPIYYPPR